MGTLRSAAVIPSHRWRSGASLVALFPSLSLAGLVGFVAAFGCADPEPAVLTCFELEVPASARPPNLVVVVGDTIRRDAVSLYGGAARTPNLERIAGEGISFNRAYSTAPWTKPAVASLFTSLLPSRHGVLTHFDQGGVGAGITSTDVLAPQLETLAEVFKKAGYATSAIVSNPWLVRPYGFDQGFDEFEDSLAGWSSSARDVSLAASYWIASSPRERPWFLYLHYLDPHLPYGPLERDEVLAEAAAIAADERPVNADARAAIHGQSRFGDGGSALDLGIEPRLRLLELAYEKGIERFDRGVGEVIAALEAANLLDSTAIVVASDHGESLYSRGFGNHGTTLLDDEVAIPLLLRWPGLAQQPALNTCVTSLADVMPLLCSLSGIECPGDLDGRDRITTRTSAAAPADEAVAVVEGLTRSPRHRGIVVGSHKLLWEPDRASGDAAYRLFDLVADAGELVDLRAERADVVERLRPRLDALAHGMRGEPSPKATLPAAEVERLRQLGYGD